MIQKENMDDEAVADIKKMKLKDRDQDKLIKVSKEMKKANIEGFLHPKSLET